jgi:hypothetical protein
LDFGLSNEPLYVALSVELNPNTVRNAFDADLFMGDFNSKHSDFGNRSINVSGDNLKKFTNDHNYIFLNDDSPTYRRVFYDYEEILDLAFVNPSPGAGGGVYTPLPTTIFYISPKPLKLQR